MIRFPNPGSNIENFFLIFKSTYEHFHDKYFFTLDDMNVLAEQGLASSRGFAGARAVEQSNKSSNNALKPLFNQFKSYSELYRALGWLKSINGKSLNYSFTFLGHHIATADDPLPLFKECLLGINYPNETINNEVLERTSKYLRPFYCILKSMKDLDGLLTKDELILGPMNIDDTNTNDYNSKINAIKNLRKTKKYPNVKDALETLANDLNVQANTLGNYTRFPIAMLCSCGWATKVSIKNIYSNMGGTKFLKLTEYGEKTLSNLENSIDIRLSTHTSSNKSQFQTFNDVECIKKELIRTSIFSMLQRSGFDISPLLNILNSDFESVNKHFNNAPILFSPYQTISSTIVDDALHEFLPTVDKSSVEDTLIKESSNSTTIDYSNINTLLKFSDLQSTKKTTSNACLELTKLYSANNDINKTANIFCENHSKDNQNTFYPLIGELFNILGLNCKVSPKGNNSLRFDALIIDNKFSIPIEIKSPGEEVNISAKAVRQALENKIIILSRYRDLYPTTFETTSLALGFNLPNDRSDVIRLITDIKKTYNINISLIDLKTLTIMALTALFNNQTISIEDLSNSGGFINV